MKTNRMLYLTLTIATCLVCNRHDSETVNLAIEPKTIILSHSQQANLANEFHLAAWIFQKYVHDHSSNLSVKIFAANSLEKEYEVIKDIQSGNELTCAICKTTALSGVCRKIDVLHFPFLWKSYEHVHQMLDGEVGKMLETDLEKSGVKVLAWMHSWGFQNFMTVRQDIDCFDELSSLKFHTNQSPKYIEGMKRLGIQTSAQAYSEIFALLQTKQLDGLEQSAVAFVASKFYESIRSILITRHLYIPTVFIFSQAELERFTEEEKAIIQQAAHLARDVERALAPCREKEALDFLASKNLSLHSIDWSHLAEQIEKVQNDMGQESNVQDLLQLIRTYNK